MGVDEEEAWLNEKTTLVSSEDTGDTLAVVQVREGANSYNVGGAEFHGPIFENFHQLHREINRLPRF